MQELICRKCDVEKNLIEIDHEDDLPKFYNCLFCEVKHENKTSLLSHQDKCQHRAEGMAFLLLGRHCVASRTSRDEKRTFLDGLNLTTTGKVEGLCYSKRTQVVCGDVIVVDDSDHDSDFNEFTPCSISPSNVALMKSPRKLIADPMHMKRYSVGSIRKQTSNRLLRIDVCSPLGIRLKQHMTSSVISTTQSELNIVSGFDDLELHCNGKTTDDHQSSGVMSNWRSTHVRKLTSSAPVAVTFHQTCRFEKHFHALKFSRQQRVEFCRTFDTGLNAASRQLKKLVKPSIVKLTRLSLKSLDQKDWVAVDGFRIRCSRSVREQCRIPSKRFRSSYNKSSNFLSVSDSASPAGNVRCGKVPSTAVGTVSESYMVIPQTGIEVSPECNSLDCISGNVILMETIPVDAVDPTGNNKVMNNALAVDLANEMLRTPDKHTTFRESPEANLCHEELYRMKHVQSEKKGKFYSSISMPVCPFDSAHVSSDKTPSTANMHQTETDIPAESDNGELGSVSSCTIFPTKAISADLVDPSSKSKEVCNASLFNDAPKTPEELPTSRESVKAVNCTATCRENIIVSPRQKASRDQESSKSESPSGSGLGRSVGDRVMDLWSSSNCLPPLCFLCGICNVRVKCVKNSRSTILSHYASHGITNISLIMQTLPSGQIELKLVELPRAIEREDVIASESSASDGVENPSKDVEGGCGIGDVVIPPVVQAGDSSSCASSLPKRAKKRVSWNDQKLISYDDDESCLPKVFKPSSSAMPARRNRVRQQSTTSLSSRLVADSSPVDFSWFAAPSQTYGYQITAADAGAIHDSYRQFQSTSNDKNNNHSSAGERSFSFQSHSSFGATSSRTVPIAHSTTDSRCDGTAFFNNLSADNVMPAGLMTSMTSSQWTEDATSGYVGHRWTPATPSTSLSSSFNFSKSQVAPPATRGVQSASDYWTGAVEMCRKNVLSQSRTNSSRTLQSSGLSCSFNEIICLD